MGGNDDGIVIHHLAVIRINGRHDVGNLCAVRSRGSLKAVKHIVCRHLLPLWKYTSSLSLNSQFKSSNLFHSVARRGFISPSSSYLTRVS